jgi:hypothetical protein
MLLSALPKAADFAVPEQIIPTPPTESATAQPVSVQMLVTLASVEPTTARRRRIAAEADRGLSALERLDQTLAAGLAPVEQLNEVAAWSAAQETPEDPELRSILKEIDLRVRVELAKHEIIV